MLTAERKTEIIEAYRRDEKDSGSPEVQVALLTEPAAFALSQLRKLRSRSRRSSSRSACAGRPRGSPWR